MRSSRRTPSSSPQRLPAPAATPEGRENQLIAAAVDLAEKQLHEGTASAQVITHYLKLGSSREKLEQEKIANENILLRAKKEAMDSQARIEEMYGAALNAMRSYAGQPPMELDDPSDEYYDDAG
jgi:hypothetical protein